MYEVKNIKCIFMIQIIGLRLESTKSYNKKMLFFYLKLERLSMFRISAKITRSKQKRAAEIAFFMKA